MTADSAPDRNCRHTLFHWTRRTGEPERGSDFAAARRTSYPGSLFAFVPRSGESLPRIPMQASLASSERNLPPMKKFSRRKFVPHWLRPAFILFSSSLVLASAAFAQAAGGSPWENAVNVLMQAFTTTIARGLSLVSIVVAGLTFAFGEGGSKRVLAGVLFGVGMAIAAVNFLAWLFP